VGTIHVGHAPAVVAATHDADGTTHVGHSPAVVAATHGADGATHVSHEASRSSTSASWPHGAGPGRCCG